MRKLLQQWSGGDPSKKRTTPARWGQSLILKRSLGWVDKSRLHETRMSMHCALSLLFTTCPPQPQLSNPNCWMTGCTDHLYKHVSSLPLESSRIPCTTLEVVTRVIHHNKSVKARARVSCRQTQLATVTAMKRKRSGQAQWTPVQPRTAPTDELPQDIMFERSSTANTSPGTQQEPMYCCCYMSSNCCCHCL